MHVARRRRRGALALALLVLGLALSGPVDAQNAVGDPLCAILTPAEVGQAIGGTVTPGDDPQGCSWSALDPTAGFLFLGLQWDLHSMADVQAQTQGEALTVAGHPAWYTASFGAGILFVELDQGLLVITASVADAVDLKGAVVQLGELAVPRAGSVPGPTPAPSIAVDSELEALFPRAIGGQALKTGAFPVDALFPGPEYQKRTEAALATQGKTLADVSLVYALPADFSSTLLAIRIRDADAATLLPLWLDAQARAHRITRTPGQVAGKDVVITNDGSETDYWYARDDVIWVVRADEPALTEYFTALP